MGLFWDLLQQSQISDHASRTGAMEDRVARLEQELYRTQTLLHRVIAVLEEQSDQDIDGDGRIG